MKVAITSKGQDLGSAIDPRFGRTKYFILYEMDDGTFEVIDNAQNLSALQGAGIQAAEKVINSGAEWVLTGNCGPKAFRTLQAIGVKVVIDVSGTVEEAVGKFKQGEYNETDKANVEGHWS